MNKSERKQGRSRRSLNSPAESNRFDKIDPEFANRKFRHILRKKVSKDRPISKISQIRRDRRISQIRCDFRKNSANKKPVGRTMTPESRAMPPSANFQCNRSGNRIGNSVRNNREKIHERNKNTD